MVKKILKVILAGLVLIFLVAAIIGYRTKQNLTRFCRETKAGDTLVDIKEKAQLKGFKYFNNTNANRYPPRALVTSSGVMGRVICEVEYDGDRVVRTSIRSND